MRKSSFFRNTVILFTAMILVKIIGALLKIPLTNMLGGTGMAYFSTAYSFFNPVYTILAAGLPIIVTKLTAQGIACKKYREARAIKRASLILALIAGIIGTIFMIIFAVPFADYAASSHESLWSVLAIAPSVLFCCVASAYKGYYEGLSDMLPTALSQIIESVVKAVFGLGLSGIVLYLGSRGTVESSKVLPYSAAAAVLGISIGELCGTLFLMLRSKLGSDLITENDLSESLPPSKTFELLKKITAQSIPISLGAVVTNLSSLIDLLTISGGIQQCYIKNSEIFISSFSLAFLEESADNFGNFVYGSYTGIVLSIFMLITSLTALVTKSALPNIAALYECGKKEDVDKNINILLTGISIIGMPLCFYLGVLAEPVLTILYPFRAAEVSVSIMPLAILCFGGMPIALCGGIFSVFQAIGRSDLPIKLMMIGCAVKLALNLLFLNIPQTAVCGAALSTVTFYALIMILGFIRLKKMDIKFNMFSIFLMPMISATVSTAALAVSYNILFCNFASLLRIMLSVIAGGIVYLIMIIVFDRRILSYFIKPKNKVSQ